ncbi:MAG: TolC family protein [Deltaproteobacteria bacterium]|nr:TolC family protein [Deltaproteobacteria bacterium]
MSVLLCLLALGAPLTVGAAISRAREANERPELLRMRIEKARALEASALSMVLPKLTFRGTYRRRSEEVSRSLGGQPTVFQAEDALSGQLRLEATVVDARYFPLLSAAGSEAEAIELLARNELRRLDFEVARAFLSVALAQEAERVTLRRIELGREFVEDARRRVEAGLSARSDVSRAELELAEATLEGRRATSGVRLAKLALAHLMVVEEIGPLGEAVVRTSSAPPRELADRARENRLDLKAAVQLREAARAAANEPLLRIAPTLGVAANLRATNETGVSGRSVDWDLEANLAWTLYDGGARYADARAKHAEAREAELNLASLERSIDLELGQALESMRTAESAVEIAKERARIASVNREDVESRFRQGLATVLERVDAGIEEFDGASRLAAERHGLELARLGLAEIVGEQLLP